MKLLPANPAWTIGISGRPKLNQTYHHTLQGTCGKARQAEVWWLAYQQTLAQKEVNLQTISSRLCTFIWCIPVLAEKWLWSSVFAIFINDLNIRQQF